MRHRWWTARGRSASTRITGRFCDSHCTHNHRQWTVPSKRSTRADWQRSCMMFRESARYGMVDDRLTMRTTTGRTRTPTDSCRRHRWRGRAWLAVVICVAHLVPLSGDLAAAVVEVARGDDGGRAGVCCCGADCRCGPGGCGGAHRDTTSTASRRDGRAAIVESTAVTTGRRCGDALAPQLTQTRPILSVLAQVSGRSVPTTRSWAVGPDGVGRHAHADRSAPSPRGPPTAAV